MTAFKTRQGREDAAEDGYADDCYVRWEHGAKLKVLDGTKIVEKIVKIASEKRNIFFFKLGKSAFKVKGGQIFGNFAGEVDNFFWKFDRWTGGWTWMDVDAVSVAVDGRGHQKSVHLPTLDGLWNIHVRTLLAH